MHSCKEFTHPPVQRGSYRWCTRRCASIAVIGGTGLYSLLDVGEQLEVDTPYGRPSRPIMVPKIGGQQVALPARRSHRTAAVPMMKEAMAAATSCGWSSCGKCLPGSVRGWTPAARAAC